jgi:hypothetical protein
MAAINDIAIGLPGSKIMMTELAAEVAKWVGRQMVGHVPW